MWDWSGLGWMASENPLLLINSRVPDVVDATQPPTTYLVLDAHRTIPFQLNVDSVVDEYDDAIGVPSGIYAAPPRFRARMSHNGWWGVRDHDNNPSTPGIYDWLRRPTEFRVYLYEGQIKYTFVAVWEDMPPNVYNTPDGVTPNVDGVVASYHDRAYTNDDVSALDPGHNPLDDNLNPGLGLPYYGLLVKVEDQNGNKVLIDYCDSESSNLNYLPEGTDDCIECRQNCLAKGQIKAIRLVTGDTVAWTLVYSHRAWSPVWNPQNGAPFAPYPPGEIDDHNVWEGGANTPEALESWGALAIDKIYVFEGDLGTSGNVQQIVRLDTTNPLSDPSTCLRVSHTEPVVRTSADSIFGEGVDAIDEHNLNSSGPPLPTNYKYVIANHYHTLDDSSAPPPTAPWTLQSLEPVLRGVTVHDTEDGSTRRVIYRYATSSDPDTSFYPSSIHGGTYFACIATKEMPWIEAIFDDQSISRIMLARDEAEAGIPSDLEVSNIYDWYYNGDHITDDYEVTADLHDTLLKYASVYYGSGQIDINDIDYSYGYWPEHDQYGSANPLVPCSQVPSGKSLLDVGAHGQYITDASAPGMLASAHQPGSVGAFSHEGSDGVRRHYRVHRLMLLPEGIGDPSNNEDIQPSMLDSAFDFSDNQDPYDDFGNAPHASIYFNPYRYRAFKQDSTGRAGTRDLNLESARWITIIDEFDSWESANDMQAEYSVSGGSGGGALAIKPGQVGRRVLSINPVGYTLKERVWTYSPDGVLLDGSGIGDEYIFDTVSDYFSSGGAFTSNGTILLVPVDPSNPTGPTKIDPAWQPTADDLLMVEHRSVGWSLASQSGGGTSQPELDFGFVEFYEYDILGDGLLVDQVPISSRVQMVAEGIKRGQYYDYDGQLVSGSGGPAMYTRQIERDPSRPADILMDLKFMEPRTTRIAPSQLSTEIGGYQSPATDIVVTRVISQYDTGGTEPDEEKRLLQRMLVGSARQVRPGSAWYYPIEGEIYDDDGNMYWAFNGLVKDPENPTANPDRYSAITFTYYRRSSELGVSLDTVVDAVGDAQYTRSSGSETFDVPAFPLQPNGSAWERLPSNTVSPELAYVTSFDYDNDGVLSDIFYPSGRRWARRVVSIDTSDPLDNIPDICYEYFFSDLEEDLDPQNAGMFRTITPFEVRRYESAEPAGAPSTTVKAYFDGGEFGNSGNAGEPAWFALSFGSDSRPMSRDQYENPQDYPNESITNPVAVYDEMRRVELKPDGTGRLARADLLEPDANGALRAVGSKLISEQIEFYREVDVDGTIAAVTRNFLGHVQRRFVGMEDIRWYLPENEIDENTPENNMVLLERLSYGEGYNDVWLPTVVRRYEQHPEWADERYSEDPATDDLGIPTVTTYDWRRRPVRVDVYERGDPVPANRLRTTLTFVDHSDRPRLVVMFGEGSLTLGQAMDPAQLLDLELPDADGLVDLAESFIGNSQIGLDPLSVGLYLYGPDGEMTERRMYDVQYSGLSPKPYHADVTLRGRGGAEVYTQRPNGPATITRLDSVGRPSEMASVTPGSVDPLATPEALDGYELERSNYVYDADGNVIESYRFERTVWNSVDELNDGYAIFADEFGGSAQGGGGLPAPAVANAVRQRTLNWFDAKKRLIATAELGAESGGGYKPADPQVVIARPAQVPVLQNLNGGGQTVTASIPAAIPSDAPVTINRFDLRTGNQTHAMKPNGSVTAFEYSRAGRMIARVENWNNIEDDNTLYDPQQVEPDNDPRKRLRTEYEYRWGRLVAMRHFTTDDLQSSSTQETRLSYSDWSDSDPYFADPDYMINLDDHEPGAKLGFINSAGSFEEETRIRQLFSRIHMPDPGSGAPIAAGDIGLRYDFMGRIIERRDERDIVFQYHYDDLGRLERTDVGHYSGGTFTIGYPATLPSEIGQVDIPGDRVIRVEYEYDPRGNLIEVTAYDAVDPDNIVAHNVYDWSLRGEMQYDRQSYGELADSDSPTTDYQWSYAPTTVDSYGRTVDAGHNRLIELSYPVPDPAINPRLLTIGYGSAGSTSDAISRVDSYRSNLGSPDVADFGYMGVGNRRSLMRAGSELQFSVQLPADSLAGNSGLDNYGRPFKFITHQDGAGVTDLLSCSIQQYDPAGNRVTSILDRPSTGGSTHAWRFTYANVFDGLDRIASSQINSVTTSGTNLLREDTWRADALGNWDGLGVSDAIHSGRYRTGNLDGYGTPWALSGADSTDDEGGTAYVVDQRNQITTIDQFIGLSDPATGPPAGQPVYDSAGNLLFDNTYLYQYDAWGRLIQVNKATRNGSQIVPGNLVRHYTYDGLGRLVRTEAPANATTTNIYRHYYDGFRRIVDVLTLDVTIIGGIGGNSALQSMANQTTPSGVEVDESGTTAGFEEAQVQSGMTQPRQIHREYVWGPGDNGYDEILVYYDNQTDSWWPIQDPGGDLVAITTIDPDADNGNGKAVIVAEWAYDAYGEVIDTFHHATYPRISIGHKGLFADRLDANPNVYQLLPFGHVIYHNRNRVYAPQLGRFLQRDPNQTGQTLMAAALHSGRGAGSIAVAFNMEGLYGDGGNLYGYLRGNPWRHSDVLGLATDPFDEMDAIIAEMMGSRAAFLQSLGKQAAATALIAAQISTYLPFPGASLAGELALVALGGQGMDAAMANIAMGLVPGGKLLGGLAKFVGSVGKSAWSAAKHYAGKGGKFLRGDQADNLINRASDFLSRKVKTAPGACCFAAGTLVWTSAGLTPIEQIRVGELVLTRHHESGEIGWYPVTGVIETPQSALLVLTLRHEGGHLQAVETTDEHPYRVGESWTRADELSVGSVVGTFDGEAVVESIQLGGRREPVYNITVGGAHSYLVGYEMVWVHNCGPISPHQLSDFIADRAAKKNGFDDIHAFKQDYVSQSEMSKWDMYQDTETKMIWLKEKNGDGWIETGLGID